jgi:hypothetical protein
LTNMVRRSGVTVMPSLRRVVRCRPTSGDGPPRCSACRSGDVGRLHDATGDVRCWRFDRARSQRPARDRAAGADGRDGQHGDDSGVCVVPGRTRLPSICSMCGGRSGSRNRSSALNPPRGGVIQSGSRWWPHHRPSARPGSARSLGPHASRRSACGDPHAIAVGTTRQSVHQRYRRLRYDPTTGSTWHEPPLPL